MRSSSLSETMAGRAGHARGWLAVEHTGPWARDAVTDLLSSVLAGANLDGIRVVLIRRRASRAPSEGPRTVFFAWSAGHAPWIRQISISSLDELMQLVPLITTDEPDLGSIPQLPVVLVCTHGKRDACCAEFGRPVHRAVKDRTDADVWECSHVGGDRFAANIVILPEGLHYSRLTPSTAALPIDAYLEGHIHLPHYRGRSSLTMAEQAAEHAIRVKTDTTQVNAIEIIANADEAPSKVVTVTCATTRYQVTLREMPVLEDGVQHNCGHHDAPDLWTSWTSAEVRIEHD